MKLLELAKLSLLRPMGALPMLFLMFSGGVTAQEAADGELIDIFCISEETQDHRSDLRNAATREFLVSFAEFHRFSTNLYPWSEASDCDQELSVTISPVEIRAFCRMGNDNELGRVFTLKISRLSGIFENAVFTDTDLDPKTRDIHPDMTYRGQCVLAENKF